MPEQSEQVLFGAPISKDGRVRMPNEVRAVEDLLQNSGLSRVRVDSGPFSYGEPARYPIQYQGRVAEGREGFRDVSVWLRDRNNKQPAAVVAIQGENGPEEVRVVCKVQVTDKKYGEGQALTDNDRAVLYSLGEDGQWYMQAATEFEYDRRDSENPKDWPKKWKWGEATLVDGQEDIAGIHLAIQGAE